ncbi:unnamed protein product [Urochloa humidicola]
MADPIATVGTIMGIALAINKAVCTARKNTDECSAILTQVDNVAKIVQNLKDNEIASHPGVGPALGQLEKTLQDALELVTRCKEEQNILERVFKAEDLSSQLRQIKEDIAQKMGTVAFAAHLVPKANCCDHRQHQRPGTARQDSTIRHDNQRSVMPPTTNWPMTTTIGQGSTTRHHNQRSVTPTPRPTSPTLAHHHRSTIRHDTLRSETPTPDMSTTRTLAHQGSTIWHDNQRSTTPTPSKSTTRTLAHWDSTMGSKSLTIACQGSTMQDGNSRSVTQQTPSKSTTRSNNQSSTVGNTKKV